MRCIRRICYAISVLVLVSVVSIYNAAGWLLKSDAVFQADYAIVLAGDPRRALSAGELYSNRWVRGVYLSVPARVGYQIALDELGVYSPRQEHLSRQVLQIGGVDEADIMYLGSGSLSTYEEATELKKVWLKRKFSFIIVTSPYHVRRARMIFDGQLPDATFSVIANSHESFPVEWWTDQSVARNVLLELVKITFFKMGGSFLAQEHG
jgi:uncharacterized SAM-binding protein YcdF (DUF218 family)